MQELLKACVMMEGCKRKNKEEEEEERGIKWWKLSGRKSEKGGERVRKRSLKNSSNTFKIYLAHVLC